MSTGESVRRSNTKMVTICRATVAVLAGASCLASVAGVSGCSKNGAPTTTLSEKEKAQFKGGGPMPPDAMEHIRKLNEDAANRMKQGGGAGKAPPPPAAGGLAAPK